MEENAYSNIREVVRELFSESLSEDTMDLLVRLVMKDLNNGS